MRPCLVCSTPSPSTRCPDCQPAHTRTLGSAHRRGYDRTWRELSARARRAQPFCTTCGHPGSTDNPLTLDHSPEAWARKAAGQVIRLTDVQVLCLRHNVQLGSSRPGTDRANTHRTRGATTPPETAGEAENRLHIEGCR